MTTSKMRPALWSAVVAAALLLAGCGDLLPKPTPQPATYAIDSVPTPGTAQRRPVPASSAAASAPTLVINAPQAATGYDSRRILYTREPHRRQYFAQNQWIDTPARMLEPLLVKAIDDTRAFRAVVQAPSGADGQLRLDTEIVRLEHDFSVTPSRVLFSLRATLVAHDSRNVIAVRQFDQAVPSASEDPYGGVVAANAAVQAALADLAAFCADTAATAQRR